MSGDAMGPAGDWLRGVPMHLAERSDGVVIMRGSVAVRVSGHGSYAAIRQLADEFDGEGGSVTAFLDGVVPAERKAFEGLIGMLAERGFLLPSDGPGQAPEPSRGETAEDVFYWELGRAAGDVRSRLAGRLIVVVGINTVARRLVCALTECGLTDVLVLDDPLLRNPRVIDRNVSPMEQAWPENVPHTPAARWRAQLDGAAAERPACLVATSDVGGREPIREWNELCVNGALHFLPVVLRHMVGVVGPLVIPGETPCYECVRARENSNLPEAEAWRAQEADDFGARLVAGYHPLVPRMVADIAAFELTRFYAGFGFGPIGRMITFSPMDGVRRQHRVLRLPRCPCCSTRRQTPQTSLGKAFDPREATVRAD